MDGVGGECADDDASLEIDANGRVSFSLESVHGMWRRGEESERWQDEMWFWAMNK